MKRKSAIFLGLLLLVAFIFALVSSIVMKSNRNEDARYTIGIVVKKIHSLNGTSYKVKYRVYSTDFVKNFPAFGDPNPVGRKYFIKFEKGNPENAEMIEDYWANPDAVAPDTGWLKIPGIPDDEQP